MSMINMVMLVIVGTILIVAVAIPITLDTIASANITGTAGTIVAFIPTFLAIGCLMLSVAMVR